ncbi:hypothetical protein P168DRAFT_137697 [Aspergillus campestris IBT 28561]|uniref:Integral membrane protein n=1 Tax=Aspergillus campestris (strain IBT 28561) TaxID=1392248 RepID=A0A2I1D493_ASPC2|nr:uncharacterized protein P168DRAFT_137697 [Aspergillus campestris IBT 28561]PKY04702.1 hypothetical protein P168DRAFT_137697 [Aspergillus campestris IBT 28561]
MRPALEFTRKQRQLIASFAVVYLLLLLFCHSNSARDPTSFFFQPDVGYRPQRSLQRIDESIQYLSTFNHSFTPHSTADQTAPTSNVDLCIGIVTVKRPLQQNLDQTVGSLLDGLTPTQRRRVVLHLLIAEPNPGDHPTYHHPWVSNVVDRVLTYDDVDAPQSTIRRLVRNKLINKKSLIDYKLSLDACYDHTDAPWIMMLEDDVVTQKNWYEPTTRSLDRITEWDERDAVADWLYLRLFYTEKFLGWNAEDWRTYLGWSVAAVLSAAVAGITARSGRPSLRAVLTNRFLAVICLGFVPALIALYFLSGRVTMHPMRPGIHLMNRHGCCSQGLVFPRQKVPLLSEYMQEWADVRHSKPVDTVIERWANENRFDRLAVSPSLMQHVGAASYKEKKKAFAWEGSHRVYGAHGVWSMSFEG